MPEKSTQLSFMRRKLLFGSLMAPVKSKTKVFEAAQGGVVAIEYLMALPILLICFLTITQTALIAQAWLVVNHAAMSATRAAIVAIPVAMRSRETGFGEGSNQMNSADESPKHEYVRRAAALALTSISRKWSVGTSSTTPDLGSAAAFATVAALVPPKGLGGSIAMEAASRNAYALDEKNTRVEIGIIRENPNDLFGIVQVTLHYRFFLAIPFADKVFGSQYSGLGWLTEDRFIELSSQYSLPVDLHPLFPKQVKPGIYFEEAVLE
jgi:TadE-like protein